jgi:chemotaxis protein MotB
MSATKGFVALTLLTSIGAGGYGYWAQKQWNTTRAVLGRENAERARLESDLASCKTNADQAASGLKATQADLDALRAARVDDEKRLEAFRALTDKFRKMIDSGKLQVVIRHGRMIVKLPAEILFASGSADVSKGGHAALGEVAGVLKQMTDRRFMVAGHTDNVPISQPSPFKNNLELSIARAERVTEELIGAGMSPGRLSVAGYSEYEPVRENSSEAGRHENRRIEIVLLPNLAELPPMPETITASTAPAKR